MNDLSFVMFVAGVLILFFSGAIVIEFIIWNKNKKKEEEIK